MLRTLFAIVILLALGVVCSEVDDYVDDYVDLGLKDPMLKEEIISVAGLRKETLQFQEVIELQLPRVVELARALKELQYFEKQFHSYYATHQGDGLDIMAVNVGEHKEEYTRVYKKLLVALLEEAGNLVEDDSEGVEE